MTASERPSARLFLIAGPGTPPADLAAAIGGGAAACVLLRTAGLDETALRAAIAALRPPQEAIPAATGANTVTAAPRARMHPLTSPTPRRPWCRLLA